MKTTPLLSWDLSSLGYLNAIEKLEKQQDLKHLEGFAKKYEWKNDLSEILNSHEYEALVLTDVTRNILWVNEGFTEMTGYSRNKMLHNTPSILQSEETTQYSKNFIRKGLKKNTPFKAIITNRKKDNTIYKCELHIFPLKGTETTHYLALERQVA